MNKFMTIAAIGLFSLMTSASHADEMMPEDGMMEDDMHEAMESKPMEHGEMDEMPDAMEGDMEMDSEMEMEMEEEMESGGM
ncbi:MAG: hypothetical protein JJT87_01820 [Halomonas sp.]|nr:hypothetical protein [Halomonas sp.]MCC5900651.1 hypothetical protein [Halomonas sp.]